jgi:HK97 family phage portal protein
MKLVEKLKSFVTGPMPRFLNQSSHPSDPSYWVEKIWGGGIEAKSGIKVSEKSALQSNAVYACVKILSETLASLPLFVYRRLEPRGKERALNHSLYRILHFLANPLMTSFELRETLMGHVLTWGNGYAELERNNGGRILNLWPLRPDRMRIEAEGLSLKYFYTLPNGTEIEIPKQNLLHIKGLSLGGYVGESVIGFARESIGLSLATEEFGSRFFSNNAIPGGVYQHPGRLGKEARENLQKSLEKAHQGLTMTHRMMILEEGMKYEKIGIPPEDAQFLQTRKFQLAEIARIYRIPLHLVQELDRATFSNVEQQSLDYVIHTMRPWLVRWEQAMQRDLLLQNEWDEFFIEFLVDGLLRGDSESRYKAYATGRQWGWLSADDIREMENMNPLPEGIGEAYLVPMNMKALGDGSIITDDMSLSLHRPLKITKKEKTNGAHVFE